MIGNESCDLDSVCCAVAYAHYLSVINPSCSCIPLLNCHREDISLRQDVVWLMEHLNIDCTQFMHYPEEFDPSDYKDLQVTLVDHNVPDEKLRPYVIEIIDQHVDAEAIDCPRVMEFVGSCSTLVAERLINNKDYEMPNEIATLLLSAILTDTSNLNIERVTTDKDQSVAMCLKDLVDITTDEIYNKVCSTVGIGTCRSTACTCRYMYTVTIGLVDMKTRLSVINNYDRKQLHLYVFNKN